MFEPGGMPGDGPGLHRQVCGAEIETEAAPLVVLTDDLA